jgi:hypothetical protein
MSEVDAMMNSKNKHNNLKQAMADRAVKRRNDWVDFHGSRVQDDEDHEKKLRQNYFADRS